jgi:hypothetical protein
MATNYPNWAAGDPITASMLNYTQGDVIVKTVATSRASTTTVTDDPDLTATLDANATYLVEMIVHAVSAATGTPLIKTQWTVPSGATGNRTSFGPGSSATETDSNNISVHAGVHGFTTALTYGRRSTSDSNQIAIIETAIVTTTSSGTLALQWAQAASSSTASQVSAGSCMRVKRVA